MAHTVICPDTECVVGVELEALHCAAGLPACVDLLEIREGVEIGR